MRFEGGLQQLIELIEHFKVKRHGLSPLLRRQYRTAVGHDHSLRRSATNTASNAPRTKFSPSAECPSLPPRLTRPLRQRNVPHMQSLKRGLGEILNGPVAPQPRSQRWREGRASLRLFHCPPCSLTRQTQQERSTAGLALTILCNRSVGRATPRCRDIDETERKLGSENRR
jgi:hypothetical protein